MKRVCITFVLGLPSGDIDRVVELELAVEANQGMTAAVDAPASRRPSQKRKMNTAI